MQATLPSPWFCFCETRSCYDSLAGTCKACCPQTQDDALNLCFVSPYLLLFHGAPRLRWYHPHSWQLCLLTYCSGEPPSQRTAPQFSFTNFPNLFSPTNLTVKMSHHTVSVIVTQFCHCSTKTAIASMKTNGTNESGCSNQTCFTKVACELDLALGPHSANHCPIVILLLPSLLLCGFLCVFISSPQSSMYKLNYPKRLTLLKLRTIAPRSPRISRTEKLFNKVKWWTIRTVTAKWLPLVLV